LCGITSRYLLYPLSACPTGIHIHTCRATQYSVTTSVDLDRSEEHERVGDNRYPPCIDRGREQRSHQDVPKLHLELLLGQGGVHSETHVADTRRLGHTRSMIATFGHPAYERVMCYKSEVTLLPIFTRATNEGRLSDKWSSNCRSHCRSSSLSAVRGQGKIKLRIYVWYIAVTSSELYFTLF